MPRLPAAAFRAWLSAGIGSGHPGAAPSARPPGFPTGPLLNPAGHWIGAPVTWRRADGRQPPPAAVQGPREAIKPAAFFQLWPPIPSACDITCVATHPGVDGGPLALSALEQSPLARVSMTGIPAMGGFQAAYFGAP